MNAVPLYHFRELTPARANVELQVHTTWTDGSGTISQMLEAARRAGLDAIAITEHVRRDTDWFGEFVASVRKEARRFPELTVFAGCEAKALDTEGTLDASDEIVAQSEIVLGSVHRFPDGKGGLLDFGAVPPGEFAEMECALALGLLRAAPIDVLAHPGGMFQRRHGRYPDELFRRMMRASLERGIAFEINASYLVDFDACLRLCAEINPIVSIGSDAHDEGDVGRCRDALVPSLTPPATPLEI